jgi:hypothetical protein
VISFKSVSEKRARKWMWFGLAALAAIQLYYVQEMIAALILFSILFALVAGVALVLFLLDRASQRTLAWAEPRTARLARRGWTLVEEASKKPLHRPRSETASPQ